MPKIKTQDLPSIWAEVESRVRNYIRLEAREMDVRNALISSIPAIVQTTRFASIGEFVKHQMKIEMRDKLYRELYNELSEIVDEMARSERWLHDIVPHNVWFKIDDHAFGISDFAGFCTTNGVTICPI